MDIETLKTMQILAQTRSFSKTAAIQNVVQSTVSARIAELERSLERKLFIRTNQGVTLTEAGLLFLPYVQHMLHDLDNGIAQLHSAGTFEDRLVIGNVYSALPNFLMPVYIDYMRTYPTISVRAIAGHSTDILQNLTEGLADLAITYQLPRSRRFTSWLCLEEDFVLIAPPESDLARRGSCPVTELRTLDLLFHNWGGDFTAWLSSLFPTTRWFHGNIGNPSAIVSFVEAGIGPAILTRSTAAGAIRQGTVKEIPLTGFPLPPRWRTYLSAQVRQLSRPPVRDWMDMMKKHGLDLTPLR